MNQPESDNQATEPKIIVTTITDEELLSSPHISDEMKKYYRKILRKKNLSPAEREQVEYFESLKESPNLRKIVNIYYHFKVRLGLIARGKFILDKSILQGLRTGSIIGNPLYFPLGDELQFHSAKAGAWNTYDFQKTSRKKYMMPGSHFLNETDLAYFPLESIIDNHTDIETPEGSFNFLDIEDLMYFTNFNVNHALEDGLVRDVTYTEAFRSVGLLERYQRDIDALGIGNKEVIQVTPKGNTLILPWKKNGDKSKPLGDSTINDPALGGLAGIR